MRGPRFAAIFHGMTPAIFGCAGLRLTPEETDEVADQSLERLELRGLREAFRVVLHRCPFDQEHEFVGALHAATKLSPLPTFDHRVNLGAGGLERLLEVSLPALQHWDDRDL